MNVITQVDNLDTKWTFHHLWAHCRTTDSLSIRYSTVLCHCETDSCTMGKMSSSVKYWRQLAICTYRLSICDFKQLWMKITKMAGEMAHWEKHLLCKQENQNQGTQHLCKCWAGVCSGPLVISAQGTQRQRANQLARQPKWGVSGLSRDLNLHIQCGELLEDNSCQLLASTHMHTLQTVHSPPYTNIYKICYLN